MVLQHYHILMIKKSMISSTMAHNIYNMTRGTTSNCPSTQLAWVGALDLSSNNLISESLSSAVLNWLTWLNLKFLFFFFWASNKSLILESFWLTAPRRLWLDWSLICHQHLYESLILHKVNKLLDFWSYIKFLTFLVSFSL